MEMLVGQVKVTGKDGEPGQVRQSVVASILAGVQAAQLSGDEALAVVAGIHARLGVEFLGASQNEVLVVSATAVSWDLVVSSRAVMKETKQAEKVAATVEELVTACSPVLWEELSRVLAASDEELAVYVAAARAPSVRCRRPYHRRCRWRRTCWRLLWNWRGWRLRKPWTRRHGRN